MRPSILYTSFDEVPAPKGASTHILAFVGALGDRTGDVLLITPGREDSDAGQILPGVRQLVAGCPDENVIGRVQTFRSKLEQIVARRSFDFIHFRSIFEGLVVCDPALRGGAKLIYEANGFPSIEMPYRYPRLRDDVAMIQKLENQELFCLKSADQIITVSDLTRRLIEFRLGQAGFPIPPIQVIRNGFEPRKFLHQPPCPVDPDEPLRVVYTGTLSWWQGIEILLEAVAGVNKQRNCLLNLVGPVHKSRRKSLNRLISKMKIEDRVSFSIANSREEVVDALHAGHVTVAPFLQCRRNSEQGFCPIKLIEGMASGTPVIASDLEAVRELATPAKHYYPARAGDAGNLKNLILQAASDHDLNVEMSRAARTHVESNFTWAHSTESVCQLYGNLISQ